MHDGSNDHDLGADGEIEGVDVLSEGEGAPLKPEPTPTDEPPTLEVFEKVKVY
jgi:hypothetical protein